jgi:hypothetical protein
MDRETIEEYRILHKGAAFFTNTAIAVHKKDFTSSGINTIDDEQIGFDAANNKPVSFPLEIEKKNSIPEQEAALKSIPPWYGLFTENEQRRSVTTLSIGILAIMFLSFFFVLAAKGTKDTIRPDMPVEPIVEIKYIPSAIEMLESFSRDIVKSEGRMTHWMYNEDEESIIEMQIQKMDLIKIYDICNNYEFLSLQDIQDIKYKDGEPVVTVRLAQKRGYITAKNGTFLPQNSAIQMINQISNSLQNQKVSISSEILPSDYNGKNFYTIAYTAKDLNLISSLEIIAAFCNEHLLNIKKMDVSIAGGNDLFTVNVSLSQSIGSNQVSHVLGNEKRKIPIAFGYREEAPRIVPPEKKVVEVKPENPRVGSIKDASGQMVFYHDTNTKKIFITESYDE